MEFEGKVALVTGGSSGIGWSTSLTLCRRGAKVAVLGRTQAKVEDAVKSLREDGFEAMACVADVTDEEALVAAVGVIEKDWGRLDILVANAGVNGVWAPLKDLTLKEWESTLSTNLTGTFLTVKACLPLLKRQGGSVVITASVNGTRMFSNTGATAYATSKAGQVAFAKMIALELAPQKIRVNVVCPGWIESEIEDNTEKRNLESIRTPVEFPKGAVPLTQGGPGRAEQVANVIAFLASDLASHVTGTEMWVDGAQSLLQG